MANIQQITRDYLLRARTEGVAATTAAAQQLGAATDSLATKTETVTKSQVSAATALDRLQRQLDTSYKSAKQFEQAQRDLDRAQQQGLLSLTSHATLLAKATQQYGQASAASRAFQTVTSGVSGQLIALSAGAGPVGTFLSALGPWGLAAAVGIGALSAALNYAIEQANKAGEKAIALRQFSDVTGLTVGQIKALNQAGAQLGIDSDSVAGSMEKLATNLDQARNAQGALYDAVRRVDGGLADQLRTSRDFPAALSIISQAWVQAGASQAAFSKSALGKGGVIDGLILGSIAAAGGIEGLEKRFQSLANVTDDAVGKLAKLKIENTELQKQIDGISNNWYATSVLEKQNEVLRLQRDITLAIINGTTAIKDQAQAEDARAAVVDRVRKKYPSATSAVPANDNPIQAGASSRVRVNADAQADIDFANNLTKAWEVETHQLGLLNVAVLKSVGSFTDLAQTLRSNLNVENERLAALGSAVTLQERYRVRLDAINADLAEHKLTDDDAARARQAAGLDAVIAKTAALNGILGVSATVQQQVAARIDQINKAQKEGAGATEAQISTAKRLAQTQADGTFQLKAQIDAMKVQTATVGMSVGQAETFSLIQTKINENLNAGRPALDGITDAYRKLAAQAGDTKQALDKLTINTQIGRDRQLALLSPEDVQIANQLKSIYPNIADALNSSEASALRFNSALAQGKADATEFTQSFVKGMMDGKSMMDALSSSLKNLSAKLADRAIVDLLSGDFEKAAIAGISAVATYIGSLLTGNSSQKLKDQIALIDKVSALQTRQVAATQDQSTLSGQLLAFDQQANIQRMMEARDGGAAMNELEKTLSEERLKIINDFNTQALAATQAAAAAQEQVMQAAQQRIQSAQDRLFTATNDPTTLEGQLAAFDRQAQADQLAEKQAGGQALLDLDAAQAAERYNIIKAYNDKITSDAQATAKTVLDANTKTAQQIVDYLNNLNVGPDSSLSPQDRLNAAQTTFNSTSALAAGGNVDALSRFTTDAENLRKAAQDYYASGAGYQAILSVIKSTATSLPVVSGSSDPLVNAMLGVKTAVVATTTAVTTDTSATSALLNQSIVKLNTTADQMTTSVELLRQLGQQDANVATGWYSRMVDQLVVIAQSTKGVFDYQMEVAHRTPTPPPTNDNSWWNPLNWFQEGGVVGAYAPGGIVGNGLFNVDSVRARYAGGGDIALAGGEGIINAMRTRQMGGAAAIAAINHGAMPANDNSRGWGGTDYSQHFARLDNTNARGFSAVVTALREEIGALRQEITRGNSDARIKKNAPPMPGKAA